MTGAEKVEFFVHCQRLLVQFHPSSPFVCRRDNITDRLHQIKPLLDKYKGMCYQDDFVCTLYNKIVVNRAGDVALDVRDNMYKPPAENYNAAIIDFAAFREMKDCLPLVLSAQDPRIQNIVFVRHNQIKLYPVVDFVAQALKIPVV